MGRLCPQKGFDVLLEAFASVAADLPSARLVVLGKGSDREGLLRQAAALGIADRVDFPGWLPNPYALLSRATVFVMSSRYEGFPNALLEAMACGVPAVATDCPSGPSEILEGEVGILVPIDDAKGISGALRKILQDPALRDHSRPRGAAARRGAVLHRPDGFGLRAAFRGDCRFRGRQGLAGREEDPGDQKFLVRITPELPVQVPADLADQRRRSDSS